MPGIQDIEREFQKKVASQIRLASEGIDRYRVFTPFLFEDGDHLAIVFKRRNGNWVLSDEAHTFMHLTYDLEEKDLRRGTRQKIISNALSSFGINENDEELYIVIKAENYGDALFSFVQGLLKIADVNFLSRERVRSTFLDDFRSLISEIVTEERRTFDWSDSDNDPQAKYSADCRINGMLKPLMVFALPSDDQTRDATISILQFEKWKLSFRTLAIFEDQESINRKVLSRFSDVCEKQFSNLGAKDRITGYLEEAIRTA